MTFPRSKRFFFVNFFRIKVDFLYSIQLTMVGKKNVPVFHFSQPTTVNYNSRRGVCNSSSRNL